MNRPLTIPSHRRPVPPGEILLREFLEPLGVTQADFAKRIGVTAARLSEIIHGKRPVTMDTALRLERARQLVGRVSLVALRHESGR